MDLQVSNQNCLEDIAASYAGTVQDHSSVLRDTGGLSLLRLRNINFKMMMF